LINPPTIMHATSHPDASRRTVSGRARLLIALLGGAVALLSGSCSSPKTGTSDPKSFIKEGRVWGYSNAPATPPPAPASN